MGWKNSAALPLSMRTMLVWQIALNCVNSLKLVTSFRLVLHPRGRKEVPLPLLVCVFSRLPPATMPLRRSVFALMRPMAMLWAT